MKREHTLKVGRFNVTGEYEAVPIPEEDGSWGRPSEEWERLELQAAIDQRRGVAVRAQGDGPSSARPGRPARRCHRVAADDGRLLVWGEATTDFLVMRSGSPLMGAPESHVSTEAEHRRYAQLIARLLKMAVFPSN
jgi:hypothetical protein